MNWKPASLCAGGANDQKVGIYFSAAVLTLEDTQNQGGTVVAKTLAKLIFSIAALTTATWFGTSSSRA
jgi:hypothetical protein